MDWKAWIICILISVGGGAAWYGLYCLCIRLRKKHAEKKGVDARLSIVSDWFLSLGMFMLVIFWVWALRIKNWGA